MSASVIVLDANKLAESGILRTDSHHSGKLAWNLKGPSGPQQVALRYSVDTTSDERAALKLEYRVTLPNGQAEEMNYRIPIRHGFDSMDIECWAFVCPSTRKLVTKLMLYPGERYFIGDMRSVIRIPGVAPAPSFEEFNRMASGMVGSSRATPAGAVVEAPRAPAPPPPAPTRAPAPAAAPAPSAAPSNDPLRAFARRMAQWCVEKQIVLNDAGDPFVRFGVQLFLLGAANGLANSGKLDRTVLSARITQAVADMGMTTQRIADMMQRQEEYLGIPKYALMLQLGEDTMFAALQNEQLAAKFADAMDRWRNRVEAKNTINLLTFMFTDIVQSVQFTQAHGDRVLHDLISAHNSIVRGALRAESGREVKHTGDGIMAVFDRSSDAIACGIRIQRDIKKHNASGTPLPLRVRIGINAGEARIEDNDYLGIAVQLAARVCAAAESEEVLVSSTTRDLAAGTNYSYGSPRELTLKGFAETKMVSSVIWNT